MLSKILSDEVTGDLPIRYGIRHIYACAERLLKVLYLRIYPSIYMEEQLENG